MSNLNSNGSNEGDGPQPYGHKPTPQGDPWQRAQKRGPQFGGPIFNGMPAIILILVGLMVGIFFLDGWAAGENGNGALHGFFWWVGGLTTGAIRQEVPPAPLFGLSHYLFHVFLHGGILHLAMNAMALLAFGAAAARPFRSGITGNLAFLGFFFVCGIAGAVFHELTHLNSSSIMIGASTAVSGVLAAAGYAQGGRTGMMRLAMPWLLMNTVFALMDLVMAFPIAWAGHIGGLVAGVILYPLWLKAFGRRLPPRPRPEDEV